MSRLFPTGLARRPYTAVHSSLLCALVLSFPLCVIQVFDLRLRRAKASKQHFLTRIDVTMGCVKTYTDLQT